MNKKIVFWLIITMLISLMSCISSYQESAEKITNTVITTPSNLNIQTNFTTTNKTINLMPPCEEQAISTHIEVDISDQQLSLYCRYTDREEIKKYSISTSKYGIGSQAGSNKTPLGKHVIKRKIGDNAPIGTIFKARQNTGRIASMNLPNTGDLVTTRIMWLKGLEPGKNSGRGIDSFKRYIYIHGTAEENKIGQPASHGCIRMYNEDVIDLFSRVAEGSKVNIKE